MPDNLWPILGLGALIIAGVFAVFVPHKDKVMTLQGAKFIIVRWFHSAVWILLAISFFMHAAANETLQSLANLVAALAGLLYLVYMITFLRAMTS